jgi:tetratricopeptide (TPR) repeat protein
MIKIKATFIFVLFVYITTIYAQTPKIDSMKQVLQKQTIDTSRAMTLVNLSWELSNLNLQSADSVCQICIKLSQKINFSRGLAGAYNTLGKVRILQNNPKKSIEAYLLAEKEYIKQGQRKGLATIYSNLGNVYGDIGQPEKALYFYYKSLSERKKINDEKGLGDCYNNLGVIYKIELSMILLFIITT